MSLILHYHPLSSFCMKVMIALYERESSFEGRIVNLGDAESSARLLACWPLAKIPVLEDTDRGLVLPETSIIIEHVDRVSPGPARLIPADPGRALQVRLWDRVFDLYVNVHMGKIVTDRFRPEGCSDPQGVEDAMTAIGNAYNVIEHQLRDEGWIAGDTFTMADCAAAPALFYANTIIPLSAKHPKSHTYLERLLQRPSVARVIDDARPFFKFYPLKERLPEQYRTA